MRAGAALRSKKKSRGRWACPLVPLQGAGDSPSPRFRVRPGSASSTAERGEGGEASRVRTRRPYSRRAVSAPPGRVDSVRRGPGCGTGPSGPPDGRREHRSSPAAGPGQQGPDGPGRQGAGAAGPHPPPGGRGVPSASSWSRPRASSAWAVRQSSSSRSRWAGVGSAAPETRDRGPPVQGAPGGGAGSGRRRPPGWRGPPARGAPRSAGSPRSPPGWW